MHRTSLRWRSDLTSNNTESAKRIPIRLAKLNHNRTEAVRGDVDGDGSLAGGDGDVFGLAFLLGDEEND